ncbi:TPA: polysaccharide biosynthesis C-terminal domain-containing protein [Citrobacter farmeri]|uniref:oligosaccharide flippase family protein n=1 Tax=Citrobacter farmeri TaxID=67824 RepID=UPI001E3D3BA9|nr:polysaccharide biosynthesis C-terminal domain-containing protein [Citrobacter farmeri]HEM7973296.1 polysaccharide biosynthesis C-terminal domain-containing protein [Citrobacter farmeri]HEM7987002.1 polysaccharide biosynthesis C-terminal domain-containing protein [Citrobacter farmeri]
MNLFKNTVLFSFERLLRTGLGFLVSIMITKAYGIETYGEYAYYFAIINILGVALSLGLDDYFVRCAAEGHKLPIKLLHIRIVLSGVAFLFCCLVLYWKQAGIDFWVISLLSLTYIWNCFYLLLIVLDKPNKHKSILALISISLFFILLKFLVLKLGFITFIGITLLETLATTSFLYFSIRRVFDMKDINLKDIKSIFKLSLPVGISSLSVMLFYRLDQMIVEHYLGVKVLGAYALSASMILAAGYLQSAYVTGMYSSIGYAKNNGSQKDLQNALLKAYRGAIYIGLFVYIGYIVAGRLVINIIFPEISLELISLLDVGMISILFSGLATINSQYLFFHDYSKKRLIRTLISLLFNVLWNMTLIPKFGVMVAIWGYVITQIIMGVLFNIFDKVTRELFILQLKSLFAFRVNKA